MLAACGIVVRKNTETVNRLNEKWWAEICRGSSRDQLSFPYTLGTISKYIKTEWRKPFNSKYTKWHPHNKNTKNEDISDKKKQIELDYIIKNFY